MCFMPKQPKGSASAPILTDPTGAEANRQADIEARLRRRRAGAAANVLTGPRGIPSTSKLGDPA